MSEPELDKDFSVVVVRDGKGFPFDVRVHAKVWRTDGVLTDLDGDWSIGKVRPGPRNLVMSWTEEHVKAGLVQQYEPQLVLADPGRRRVSYPSKSGEHVANLIRWTICPRLARWRSNTRMGDLVIGQVYGQVAAFDVLDV